MSQLIKTFDTKDLTLEKLNENLSKVKKNITYYDAINIVDRVLKKEDYIIKVNNLTPNSSLVISTATSFTIDNELFNIGDVIIKNAIGEVWHIPSQSGGVFYPSELTAQENSIDYTLTYKYQPNPPSSQEIENIPTNNQYTAAYAKMPFKIKGLLKNNDKAYNIFKKLEWKDKQLSCTFNSITSDSKDIRPLIKFYFEKESSYEEVCLEYKMVLGTGEWTVTLLSTFSADPNIYIKVK